MDAKLKAELDSMAQPMSTLEEPRLFRGLFYGDPGAGKTDLACRLVRNKGVIFTTDSAWVTVLKYPELAEMWTKFTFHSFAQIRAFVEAHKEGIEPYASFDTVLWDTVSTSVDQMLRIMVDGKKHIPAFQNQQIDPLVEGWPHFRLVERALRDTISVLNDSDLNIIYTAHVKEPTEKQKEQGKLAIRPNMPEASFKVVAQEVQLIGWLSKDKQGNERKIQIEGTKQVVAKSQISTIPERTYPVNEIPKLIQEWQNP